MYLFTRMPDRTWNRRVANRPFESSQSEATPGSLVFSRTGRIASHRIALHHPRRRGRFVNARFRPMSRRRKPSLFQNNLKPMVISGSGVTCATARLYRDRSPRFPGMRTVRRFQLSIILLPFISLAQTVVASRNWTSGFAGQRLLSMAIVTPPRVLSMLRSTPSNKADGRLRTPVPFGDDSESHQSSE